MKKCSIYLFICLLGIVVTNSAVAQTKSTLLRSGSSNNKLDVVIIGDGFTSSEQSDYNDYVKDRIMDEAFANDIFSEIRNAFNIHRVNAISNDSDVTRVDADGDVTIERDTALDYEYSGIWDRCWMEPGSQTNNRIDNIMNELNLEPDFVFIVLNVSSGGGCRRGDQIAGTINTSWTTWQHEMGHTVGNLADEYCRMGCYDGGEPNRVNVTKETDRAQIKWRQFIDPDTTIPTSINQNPGNGNCTNYNQGAKPAGWSGNQDVGLFEGAQYKDDCIYRPSENSRMRGNTPDFNPPSYLQLRDSVDDELEARFRNIYKGDFNNDNHDDMVFHYANSLFLYISNGEHLELVWTATDFIPGSWQIRNNDKYVVGDFDNNGSDDLYVFNGLNWVMPYVGMLRWNGSEFRCVKRFDRYLPGWEMKPKDHIFSGDLDGDGRKDLLLFNGNQWVMPYLLILRSSGANLEYRKRYDRYLPGWEMKSKDRFHTVDFEGDSKDDLAVFNGNQWAMPYLLLNRSTGNAGNALTYKHRYDSYLPGWEMKSGDKQYVGDFNGDGKEDLYIFNGKQWVMPYLLMVRSNGNDLSYTRRFDKNIPGWTMRKNDSFYVGDTTNDGKDDLFVLNTDDWSTEYLGILKSNGSTLSGSWQDGWINSWNLGSVDNLLVANFSGGSSWDDLYIYNDNWFGLLRSYGTSMKLESIYPSFIRDFPYQWHGHW